MQEVEQDTVSSMVSAFSNRTQTSDMTDAAGQQIDKKDFCFLCLKPFISSHLYNLIYITRKNSQKAAH